ncbi:MAG: hypothetical protein DSZ11_00345 [Sulfurovum sp.]|nr:MAG: hypothetical protein DSZ11_00345 [Sulfurovum sp.]
MFKLLLILFPMLLVADMDNIFPFQIIKKANRAYRVGDYTQSIKLFKSLEKDDPSVVYNLANAEYKLGHYDTALHYYERAKGVNEATRLYNIGNIYFRKKELDRAIESYEASLAFREDVDTRYNLELAKKRKAQKNKKKKKDKKEQDKKKKKKKEQDKKK